MRRSSLFLAISTIQVVSLAGCGDDEVPPAAPPDAGVDAEGGVEAGPADVSAPSPDAPATHDAQADVVQADISVPADAAETGVIADVGASTDADAGADAADAMIAADGGDASVTDALLEAASAELPAFVRFAALSPDAPAVDFCVRPRAAPGSADRPWQGPLIGALGAPSGLAYPQLTGYIPLAADTYDIRVLTASQTATCDAQLLSGTYVYSDVPRLAPGSSVTLVLAGHAPGSDAQRGLDLQAFQDEQTAPPGQAELRIIHASPDAPSVNVGFGTGESFVPLASYLSYLGFARGGPFDFNGYLLTPPISGQTLELRDTSNQTELLIVNGFSLPADSVTTVFAIGVPGSTSTPLKLLNCDDLSASGLMTYCTRLPLP